MAEPPTQHSMQGAHMRHNCQQQDAADHGGAGSDLRAPPTAVAAREATKILTQCDQPLGVLRCESQTCLRKLDESLPLIQVQGGGRGGRPLRPWRSDRERIQPPNAMRERQPCSEAAPSAGLALDWFVSPRMTTTRSEWSLRTASRARQGADRGASTLRARAAPQQVGTHATSALRKKNCAPRQWTLRNGSLRSATPTIMTNKTNKTHRE